MSNYNREELVLLNQILLALFLVADFALFLHFSNSSFPWFALLGAGIGLAIIVLCCAEKVQIYFIASLLVFTGFFLLIYNWHSLFH